MIMDLIEKINLNFKFEVYNDIHSIYLKILHLYILNNEMLIK